MPVSANFPVTWRDVYALPVFQWERYVEATKEIAKANREAAAHG